MLGLSFAKSGPPEESRSAGTDALRRQFTFPRPARDPARSALPLSMILTLLAFLALPSTPQSSLPQTIAVDVECARPLGRFLPIHGVQTPPRVGDWSQDWKHSSWDVYVRDTPANPWDRSRQLWRADFLSSTRGPWYARGEDHFDRARIPQCRTHPFGVADMQRLWRPTKATLKVLQQPPTWTTGVPPDVGLYLEHTVEPAFAGENPALATNYDLAGLLDLLDSIREIGNGTNPHGTTAVLRFGTGRYYTQNGFGVPVRGMGVPPDDFAVFAQVVGETLSQLHAMGYDDVLEYVEVWNEPYLDGWWTRGVLPTPANLPTGITASALDAVAGVQYADLFAAVQAEVDQRAAAGSVPSKLKVVAQYPGDPTGAGTQALDEWRRGFVARKEQLGFRVDAAAPHFYTSFAAQVRERRDKVRQDLGSGVELVVSEWNRNGSYARGRAAMPFVWNMFYELNGGPDAAALPDPATTFQAAQMYATRTSMWTGEYDAPSPPPHSSLPVALNVNKSPGLAFEVYGEELYSRAHNRVEAFGSHIVSDATATQEFTVMAGLTDALDELDLVASLYVAPQSGSQPNYTWDPNDTRDLVLHVTNLPFSGLVQVERLRETATPDYALAAARPGAVLEPVPGTPRLAVAHGGALGVLLPGMIANSYELIRVRPVSGPAPRSTGGVRPRPVSR